RPRRLARAPGATAGPGRPAAALTRAGGRGSRCNPGRRLLGEGGGVLRQGRGAVLGQEDELAVAHADLVAGGEARPGGDLAAVDVGAVLRGGVVDRPASSGGVASTRSHTTSVGMRSGSSRRAASITSGGGRPGVQRGRAASSGGWWPPGSRGCRRSGRA